MQEDKLRKGPWHEEEDERLISFVALLGERRWDSIAKASGLRRTGKSCRLRWMNYLRPDLKHGRITAEEEIIIGQLHDLWGNKWSRIAQWLPGRTDNEVKNYWRSYLKKKSQTHEQGNFGACSSNGHQDVLIQSNDLSSLITNSYGDLQLIKENIIATATTTTTTTTNNNTNNFYYNNNLLADLTFFVSPHEIRSSDFISGFSSDQSATNHQGEGSSVESCFNDPMLNIEDCYDLWEYCGSI